MVRNYVREVALKSRQKVDAEELGKALHCCTDLAALQNNSLTRLPSVVERARSEGGGLELAKALHKELLCCSDLLTQRPRYPIEEIVAVIEESKSTSEARRLAEIQSRIGIPFSRKKIDLARYYAIRLVMEGIKVETIAEFLKVDNRSVGYYIAQAKERILLAIDTRNA